MKVRMVDHAGSSTHTPTLVEIIDFPMPARGIDPAEIIALYSKHELSCNQIASKLGCSKTFVVTTLKRRGPLRTKAEARSNPNNYRNKNAPFGYRVRDGKLIPLPSEIKICRLIVDLIERKGFNTLQAAKLLSSKGIKTRAGKSAWHNQIVSRIYARWKGKV